MKIKLSKENFDTLLKLDLSDAETEIELYPDENALEFSDIGELLIAINDEIVFKGMTSDMDTVTPFGRKIYALYDEIYYTVYDLK